MGFSLPMNGINFVDALKLRWDDQQGNKFVFYRHKTRRTRRNNIRAIEVKVSPKIQELLDKIGDKESSFVLGQISDEEYTEQYLINKNHKLKGKVNHYLKKLGKRLGLSMSLDISLAERCLR
jgi:hypothetical protein